MSKSQANGKGKWGKSSPWRSLNWQLLFLAILPLTVLLLGLTFGSLTVHNHAMRTLVGERDARAVRVAAEALDEQISHRILAVRSLAQLSEGTNPGDIERTLASSDYLLSEFDQGVALFTADGVLRAALGEQALWENLELQAAAGVADLLADPAGATNISRVAAEPAQSEPLMLVLAVSPGRTWVAAGVFSSAQMVRHTLADTFSDGMQTSVFVIDADRNIHFQGGEISAEHPMGVHPGVAEALAGKAGTAYMMVGQEEHVIAYSPIPQVGWALVFEEPWETVSTPTLQASQLTPLTLVPVLIGALFALWFGARQIVRPLQMLEARTAQLAWGDFKAIEEPVGGIEEIRHLQEELVRMAGKVQAAQQSLHGYIGAITAAQEDERRRLARELHDDTIQALIALKQRVQLAQLRMSGPDSESAALKEIVALTEQTIENLRRLTRALRPIYLEDLGLVTALEMLAKETGLALNIPVVFERTGTEKRLDPALELALYRMAQEAFSNIARHAQANQAAMRIRFTDTNLILLVGDNGKGFVLPKKPGRIYPQRSLRPFGAAGAGGIDWRPARN